MPHFHKKDILGIDTTTRIARILSIIAPNSASIDAERFQPPVIPPLTAFYDYGSRVKKNCKGKEQQENTGNGWNTLLRAE